MPGIAVLGSEGTFSDCAAQKYAKIINSEMKRFYYPTIDDVFYSVGKECARAIVPIENTLDGYVQRSLGLLLEMNVQIINEITIPVQFSLISNTDNLRDIDTLYVQFKAKGQCRDFIKSLNQARIITTEDNMASFDSAAKGVNGEAAIVPQHMYGLAKTRFGLKNITDSSNNFTRFLVVAPNASAKDTEPCAKIKAALYIIPEVDRPGILYEMLKEFAVNNINLISIMSKPTGKNMGTYNFYIELSGAYEEKPLIIDALNKIGFNYRLKILGIYSV